MQAKIIRTTLDDLPAGEGNEHNEARVRGKNPLPEGVTSKMLYKDVLRIAWPSFVEMMLMQLASMVDLMMVGKLGPWAISAVGLTTQPKFLMGMAFMSLNVGNMALVARYRGAGKQEEAKLVLRQSSCSMWCSAPFCRRWVLFLPNRSSSSWALRTPRPWQAAPHT